MYVTQFSRAGHIPSRPSVTFLKPIGIFPRSPYWQMRFSGSVDVMQVDWVASVDTKNDQIDGAVRKIRIPRELREKSITHGDIEEIESVCGSLGRIPKSHPTSRPSYFL